MTSFLRKDFAFLMTRSSSHLCKSRVYFPTWFHRLYSTSREEEPIFNSTVYDLLLHKHHFTSEAAREVASAITRFRNPEKSDSLLSFLKKNEFSNSHLGKILMYNPLFISADLEKSVKPKIEILQQLGLTNSDIAELCSNNASILYRSADNSLIPALSVLRRLLGSDDNVVKLLNKCGWFLITDLEKCMVPNVEFLKSRRVHMDQIIRAMHSFPRFLLHSPEYVRRRAEKAEEFGAQPSSKMYIHALRVVASMSDETWELKLRTFRSLGFSEGDILKAFSKYPPAFSVSVKKMMEVRDIVLSSGKYDVASFVRYPMSLAGSIEWRFRPRLQVLAALEEKKLIKKWPSLATLCCDSDESFFKKFVYPNIDEVGHLFVVKGSISGKSKPMLSLVT